MLSSSGPVENDQSDIEIQRPLLEWYSVSWSKNDCNIGSKYPLVISRLLGNEDTIIKHRQRQPAELLAVLDPWTFFYAFQIYMQMARARDRDASNTVYRHDKKNKNKWPSTYFTLSEPAQYKTLREESCRKPIRCIS